MIKRGSRKAVAAGSQAEATPAKHTGLSLVRLNFIPLLVSVLVVLASGYAAYLQFASLLSERRQEKNATVAHELAAMLAGRLEGMSDELEHSAQADEALLKAIANRDIALLRQREAALADYYPDALRIRYILPSEREPDRSLTPKLGYACLDLARRAEVGKTPPFEVHLFGDEQQHLDLVRPVLDGKTPVASLMVTLDVAVVKHWLDVIKSKQGYIELLQGDGDDALPLFAAGDSVAKGGVQLSYTAPVALSRWRVRYYPEHGIGLAETRLLGFVATFGVAAAILLLFYIVFNWFLSGLLQKDLRRLVGYIADISQGKRFHSYPVKLVEAKKILHEKEGELFRITSQSNVKTPRVIKDRMIEDEEIPDLTFVGEDGMSVEEVAEGSQAQREKV